MKIINLLIKNHKQGLILTFFTCIYILYFTVASFLRYDNFYTGRFDLGNMDQTVWNTINGRIFQTSSDDGPIISRLSTHADFMLILLSPFYLLWSHPKTLLLIQTIVLAVGAIFVFLIAKNVFKNKNFALFFGFSYLMYPAIQFTNLYDFHAVAIATTTLLAAFYFLIKQKYFLLLIFLILSGITKEQVWLITSLFGFPLLFKQSMKIKMLGAGIIFFSLAIFGFLGYFMWYVIPQTLDKQYFALSYYSDFGNSPTQILSKIIFSPQKILSTLLETSRLDYLRQLLMPLGFLSFLNPLRLVFAVPDLFITLLSNNPQLRQIYYQYSSSITPFIFISAIYGAKTFIKRFPKIPKFYLAIYLLIFTFLSSFQFGPLPGSKNPNLDMFTKPQANKQIIDNVLAKISEEFSVAATNNLGSHISQRINVATIPSGMDKADVILFLLNDRFAQPSLEAQKKMVSNLKQDRNYTKVFEKGDFVVFKKQGVLL